MKILDRYVMKEMLWPFLFGVATFTILFIAGGLLRPVVQMLGEKQAPLVMAFSYVVNSIPYILVFTFPMATLLAALLAFGRFSGDSELVAMRAGGISFFRIAVPGIILALLITVVGYLLNDSIAPDATYRANNILYEYMSKNTQQIRHNMLLQDTAPDGSERLYAIRMMDGEQGVMKDITVIYYKNGKRERQVFADRARWDGNSWLLEQPRTIDFNDKGTVQYESASKLAVMPLLQTPQELSKRERSPRDEMNSKMMKEKLKVMAKGLINNDLKRDYNELLVTYYQKLATPFTCLVFGLFGIPLGVRPQRTSTSIGLGLSLVFIFIYYVLMMMGMALGKNGSLTPFMGAWLPNVVFGGIGIYLLLRMSKV
ncbi:MAG: LptF/LptG family permease [Chloroflexi bacterium]|nr:LptF/LptG family permease [Chloroflexota bacterium]